MSPAVKAVETNTGPIVGNTGESSQSSPRSQQEAAQWCLEAQPQKYGQHPLQGALHFQVVAFFFLEASFAALAIVGTFLSSTLKLELGHSLMIQFGPHPDRLESCFPTCCPHNQLFHDQGC